MTQDELDAMMGGDVDIDTMELEDDAAAHGERPDHVPEDEQWPPPAPTDDNKMVHQLDDVTRESEIKASEVFDIIESIGDDMMKSEDQVGSVKETVESTIATLSLLNKKFPSIKTFETLLEENQNALEHINNEIEMLQNSGDQIMNIMDIMQYQDIHRQKIERVINVMRALSKYMNTLFSSQKDDSTRVSSAQHIAGDSSTEDVMGNDDIEALLNSFGNE